MKKREWFDVGPFELAKVIWEGSDRFVVLRGIDITYEMQLGKRYKELKRLKDEEREREILFS